MRGIYLQHVSFSITSKLSIKINGLILKNILGVDIHHTFSNSLGLSLASNNKYFHVVTAKKQNGTALAHNKGKTWKH
jgi:hypothetical protein